MQNNKQYDIDHVLSALAEPTRRALVERLGAGPASVSDLAKPFGITLAAVVQHLQVLEACKLVRSEKIGRVRTCRLDPAGLDVVERWIDERRRLAERRFDRLAELLGEHEESAENPTLSPTHKKKGKKP